MQITFEGETLYHLGDQMVVALLQMGHPFCARETGTEANPGPEATPVPEDQEKAPDGPPVGDREGYDDTPPEDPKPPKISKFSKPKTPKPVITLADIEKARKEAISRLMVIYNIIPAGPPKIKSMLKDFGVAKFSEVSDAQVPDLLDRTAELEKELA
jgi:hypothetical protein